MDCRHHENLYEALLSTPDSDFFYLSNIANNDFLDILMLGLICAVSLAIVTTDKMRCHTKHVIKRSFRMLFNAKAIFELTKTSFFRNSNIIESISISNF